MTTHTTSTDPAVLRQCWHHSETIKCPKCGLIQDASVQHTAPFWAYVHECSCGYWITESEWDTVPTPGLCLGGTTEALR